MREVRIGPSGRRCRRWWRPASGLVLLAVAVVAAPAGAVMQLNRGDEVPRIELADLEGQRVSTDQLRGKILVVIFGELYHERTLEACRLVEAALADERLQGEPIVALLVVTQDVEPARLKEEAAGKPLPSLILHDRARQVSGAYQVAVLPSVVVIDRAGRVVQVLAALTTQFADVLGDSLLLAAGKIDAAQFDQRRQPQAGVEPSAEQARADRLARLARQLVRRGLVELAAQKYAEALEVVPDHAAAQLGLGVLQLRRGRLAEAEQQFGAVLAAEPDSVDAALGLASVQTRRGGDELASAQALVDRALARHPMEPRAHYQLGLIQEKQGHLEEASASFKRAAELLLEQATPEATP